MWLFGLALSGCALVGPDYAPPEEAAPASWHGAMAGGLSEAPSDSEIIQAWWTVFDDAALSGLIDEALDGNKDLKQAESRVRESRARRGISQAGRFPTLDLAASATTRRGSEETGGSGDRSELYSASFDASWEIDLFGGVRRSVAAAEADLSAVQENLRDVQVSLLAEVGLNYLEVRTFQRRLSVAQANLAAQQETYHLTLFKFKAGLIDELAVDQARYNLETTRAQIPNLKSGLDAAQNRLAVLLGQAPGNVHARLAKPGAIPLPPRMIAVGVPTEVLRRRPDIRRAERELAAQTERVGVATADLYPKLTLSGSIGVDALAVGGLFNGSAIGESLGPRLSWSLFNAGAVRSQIAVASALQEQALIRYESTVLSALEEVENALTAYAQEQSRQSALTDATRAARRAAALAENKYEAGLIDFSAVLDAQRSLLSLEDQSAQSEGTIVSNLVRLYKALGGGWSPSDRVAARSLPKP